jgi:hypothetical protein
MMRASGSVGLVHTSLLALPVRPAGGLRLVLPPERYDVFLIGAAQRLVAEAIHAGVRIHERRVGADGLSLQQPGGLALVEYPREHLPEHFLGHALAGLAQRAFVWGPFFERVAEEATQRQRVGEAVFQFGVVDDVLEEASQHALEEDHGVQRRPAKPLRVERSGQVVDELQIEHLVQSLVEVALGNVPVDVRGFHEQYRLGLLFASLAHRLLRLGSPPKVDSPPVTQIHAK